MFRLAQLLCSVCVTPYQEIPEQAIRHLYPTEITSSATIARVQNFEQVYSEYAPRIIKEFGVEISELCWQRPSDPRAQFVNRFVNTHIIRLANIPADERDNELPAIKLLIPASRKEYDYIRGVENPIPAPTIGKKECWPLRNKEIRTKINAIREVIKAEKEN